MDEPVELSEKKIGLFMDSGRCRYGSDRFRGGYTVLPLDNLNVFLGMEDARETISSGNSWGNLTASQKESLGSS